MLHFTSLHFTLNRRPSNLITPIIFMTESLLWQCFHPLFLSLCLSLSLSLFICVNMITYVIYMLFYSLFTIIFISISLSLSLPLSLSYNLIEKKIPSLFFFFSKILFYNKWLLFQKKEKSNLKHFIWRKENEKKDYLYC